MIFMIEDIRVDLHFKISTMKEVNDEGGCEMHNNHS